MYRHDPLVAENQFLTIEPEAAPLPGFEESRSMLPSPHWPSNPDAIRAYWHAWSLAWDNLRRSEPGSGFVSNFIDTAFNGCLFMWDSAFIVQFGRYGHRAFTFQNTLDNLYSHQHPDGFICREIRESDGSDVWNRYNPMSTGPNVLAWAEWEHFANHGDLDRLRAVYPVLLAYHRWTRRNRTWPDGSYWTTGLGCGMDNMPRVTGDSDAGQDHSWLSWVDATLQAILSARLLGQMADLIDRDDAQTEKDEAAELTEWVNQNLWSEADGFYLDRSRDGSLVGVKSVAGYWALLAGVATPERVQRLADHLRDPRFFNTEHRVPSLAADAPGYEAETGDYWRGAVWPPTNTMILRGLSSVREDDLAFEIALNHFQSVLEVFRNTGTFWENYSPSSIRQGSPAKPNFVGWSGLPPIAVLIEYIFGLRPIDALQGKLQWDIRLTDEFGLDNYPLGPKASLNLRCAQRASQDEEPKVEVTSTHPVEVTVCWHGGSKTISTP